KSLPYPEGREMPKRAASSADSTICQSTGLSPATVTVMRTWVGASGSPGMVGSSRAPMSPNRSWITAVVEVTLTAATEARRLFPSCSPPYRDDACADDRQRGSAEEEPRESSGESIRRRHSACLQRRRPQTG